MLGFIKSWISSLSSKRQPAGPVCEELEGRMLLAAGDVTATLALGNLILVGDAQPNAITITPLADGKVRITGAGTTVNGQAEFDTAQAVTGDIRVYLKGGADVVNGTDLAVPRHLLVDLGEGINNNCTLNDFTIGGNLTIQVGDGEGDSLDLVDVTVEGNVRLAGGDARAAWGIQRGHFKKNLVVIGGAGNNYVNATDLAVDGNVTVLNGDGESDLRFQRSAGAPSIGGNLVIRCGEGSDSANITNAAIHGTVTMDFGRGSGDHGLVIRGSTLDRDVTLRNTDGYSSCIIDEGSTIGGNVTWTSQMDEVQLNVTEGSTIAGNVSITSVSGQVSIDASSGFVINGNVRIQTAGQTNVNLLDSGVAGIGGALSVRGGFGSDYLGMNNVLVAGAMTLNYGTGGSTVSVIGGAHVHGLFSLNASTGVNYTILTAATFDGLTRVTTGRGIDWVTINDSTFNAPAIINTGAGYDGIAIEGGDPTSGLTTVFELGLTLLAGAGDDTIVMGAGGDGLLVKFAAASRIDGGLGDDTYTGSLDLLSLTPVLVSCELP